jgi:HSP20 family molecular chaperone IbpA
MSNLQVGFYNRFFDDSFNSIFGRPRNLIFNCKTKDQMPSCWEKTETGFKATCRTVGITPEDVKITIENDCIKVSGETKTEDYTYNCSYELPVIEEVLNNIKSIKYKTANGLTFINLEVDLPKRKDIKIEQIK